MPDRMLGSLESYLAGRWRVVRIGRDRARGTRHILTGTARFAPAAGGGLTLDEAVTWTVGGQRLEGERRYRFTFSAPWRAAVWFADGRPFHDLDLTAGAADVAHDCPPDSYKGRYRLTGLDSFRVIWRVRGPHKDLVLTTRLTRIAGGESV